MRYGYFDRMNPAVIHELKREREESHREYFRRFLEEIRGIGNAVAVVVRRGKVKRLFLTMGEQRTRQYIERLPDRKSWDKLAYPLQKQATSCNVSPRHRYAVSRISGKCLTLATI